MKKSYIKPDVGVYNITPSTIAETSVVMMEIGLDPTTGGELIITDPIDLG